MQTTFVKLVQAYLIILLGPIHRYRPIFAASLGIDHFYTKSWLWVGWNNGRKCENGDSGTGGAWWALEARVGMSSLERAWERNWGIGKRQATEKQKECRKKQWNKQWERERVMTWEVFKWLSFSVMLCPFGLWLMLHSTLNTPLHNNLSPIITPPFNLNYDFNFNSIALSLGITFLSHQLIPLLLSFQYFLLWVYHQAISTSTF